MAIQDLNRQNLDYHKQKIQSLTENSERQWGSLVPARVCLHIRTLVELSLGDGEVKVITPKLLHAPIKFVFFQALTTWPKGKLKAPAEFTPETSKPFAEEQALLLSSLDRFVTELEKDGSRKANSPILGPQPLTFWSHIHGVHNNHHYRQYGLV